MTRRPSPARLAEAASRTRSTRRPALTVSERCPASRVIDGRELPDHRAQRLALGERRRVHVAEAVGDAGRRPVGEVRGAGGEVEVDATVVDAEPLLGVEVVPDEGAPVTRR